jgi:tRNA-dependent cyclodipeptide synthase
MDSIRVFVDGARRGSGGDALLGGAPLRPFLGISVSSRPLPVDQMAKALSWSLQGDHPVMPVLIADEIAYLNYKALSHYSKGNAMRRALRDAEFQLALWRDALQKLPRAQAAKVHFLRWPDISTAEYQRRVNVVREAFGREGALREAILDLTEGFILRTGKTVTEERKLALAEYVLEELPLLLFGVQWDGAQYQAMVYPTRQPAEMSRLVQAIRSEPAYGGLRRDLRADHLEFNTLIDLVFPSGAPAPEAAPPFEQGADLSLAYMGG